MENNNESFKLLGLSGSDTGSEVAEFVLTPRKKKLKSRRFRGSAASRVEIPRQPRRCNARTFFLSIAAILLLCWVVVLTWHAVVLHGELRRLDTNVRAVAAGSQGVPDALQKCHSVSRELQQNQTALYNRLATLTLQIGNFSVQLTGLHGSLQDVEERLKAAPELVNVPQTIKDLSASVASFGSQIKDLDTTVASLKSQAVQLHDTSDLLVQNVTLLQTSLSQVMNASRGAEGGSSSRSKAVEESVREALAQVAANLTLVNDTLMSKLNWLNDDQHKDHVAIEVLQNVGQNVTARVITLEGGCAKETAQAALISTVKKLAENVTSATVQLTDLNSKVSRLESSQQYQQVGVPVSANLPRELLQRESTTPTGTLAPLPQSPSNPAPTQGIPMAAKVAPPPTKPSITRP